MNTFFVFLFFFQSANVKHGPVFTISVNAESPRCHYPAAVAQFLNYATLSNTPACVSLLVNTLVSWQRGVLGYSPLICSSESQTRLLGETIRRSQTPTIERAKTRPTWLFILLRTLQRLHVSCRKYVNKFCYCH